MIFIACGMVHGTHMCFACTWYIQDVTSWCMNVHVTLTFVSSTIKVAELAAFSLIPYFPESTFEYYHCQVLIDHELSSN